MNVSQLTMLVAIAETGSLTQAARQLGLTQSGTSQAVSALEDDLGVQLLVRGRRGVSLTAVGERVVIQARDVLAGLEAIRKTSRDGHGLERGRLRLASFATVLVTLLPPLLRRFRALHPGIDVLALEASDDEVEAWLAAGTIDLGVVMNPAPGRAAAPLGRDEWVAVVPAGHRFAHRSGGRVALAELAMEPFVLATGGCATHARSLARDAGLAMPDVRVEVRDWASAFALVRESLGVTLVPEPTLPENRRGLRLLRLTEPLYRTFGLQRAAGAGSPAAEAFLTLAKSLRAKDQDHPLERSRPVSSDSTTPAP